MTPVINSFSWESYFDGVPTADNGAKFTEKELREQLGVTWDNSDYLWYMTEYVSLSFFVCEATVDTHECSLCMSVPFQRVPLLNSESFFCDVLV